MKIIVHNVAIEYTDEGTGPVMLMLHGWKDSLHTFDALMPELARTYRVVRLDLPGFGGSESPLGAWHLDEYVTIVKAFVEKKELMVDTLVGHSMGGRISIKAVATGALAPKRLVLIAAAGLAQRRTLRNVVLTACAKVMKLLTAIPPISFYREPLRQRLYRAIGSDYFGAGKLKDTYLNIIAENLTGAAEKVSIPTTLIWGTRDDQTPLAEGESMHELIKDSTLYTFDAGHMVHQQHPQEVAALIIK